MAFYALLVVYPPNANTTQRQTLANSLVAGARWSQSSTPFTYTKTFVGDIQEGMRLLPGRSEDAVRRTLGFALSAEDARVSAEREARDAIEKAQIPTYRVHIQIGREDNILVTS